MKKNIFLLFVSVCFLGVSYAQCDEETEVKVLLMGDSWAAFMDGDGTIDNVFDHWGQSNYKYYTNATLSVNGARTEDFLTTEKLNELQTQLYTYPSLDVVHLSISGNDFLGEWNVDFTDAETLALSNETLGEVQELINFIKTVRPDVAVFLSGYMYANFEEIIEDISPFQASHPFYETWENMGFPTFEEVNTTLNDFSERLITEIAAIDPRVTFLNSPALMQHIYGQETPLSVDPGGTYAPLVQPLPFGDITYPTPKVAMRDYDIVRDCFHLSPEAYFYMIDHQFQKHYHKFFMDEAHLLAESTTQNGSVSATVTSPLLQLGETTEGQITTILSFNTTVIPDTTIVGASIFLRRDTLIDSDPIGETVTLRMVNGNFGSSADLELEDASDLGDIEAEVCVFGTSDVDNGWIRIVLPPSFFNTINNDNITQFAILTEGEGVVTYTDLSDPEFAPVLNLDYLSEFASITELKDNDPSVIIFPNPATENLKFHLGNNEDEFGTIVLVEIVNLQGQIILKSVTETNQIDISKLLRGNYFIRITGRDKTIVKQFVKG